MKQPKTPVSSSVALPEANNAQLNELLDSIDCKCLNKLGRPYLVTPFSSSSYFSGQSEQTKPGSFKQAEEQAKQAGQSKQIVQKPTGWNALSHPIERRGGGIVSMDFERNCQIM